MLVSIYFRLAEVERRGECVHTFETLQVKFIQTKIVQFPYIQQNFELKKNVHTFAIYNSYLYLFITLTGLTSFIKFHSENTLPHRTSPSHNKISIYIYKLMFTFKGRALKTCFMSLFFLKSFNLIKLAYLFTFLRRQPFFSSIFMDTIFILQVRELKYKFFTHYYYYVLDI